MPKILQNCMLFSLKNAACTVCFKSEDTFTVNPNLIYDPGQRC